MALKYGADLVWGPETIDRALIGCVRRINPRTGCVEFTRSPSNGGKASGHDPDAPPVKDSIIYRIQPSIERKRLVFQLGTAKPETAVAAAKMVADDVAGIDVNSGCPKPFSTSGGMGAALLKDPDRLCAILRALVQDVGIPHEIGISVKIRLLDTEDQTVTLVRRLCETGITGLTVHCRTTPMRPRERAIREQLSALARTCHDAGVACVMNGDVANRQEALQLMEEFGVDGAMIATAAERNPSVFRSSEEGGILRWKETVPHYVRAAMDVENRFGNTKFLLSQMIPGKALEGHGIGPTKCYAQSVRLLGLDELADQAAQTDERLGLRESTIAQSSKKHASKPTNGQTGQYPAVNSRIIEKRVGETAPSDPEIGLAPTAIGI